MIIKKLLCSVVAGSFFSISAFSLAPDVDSTKESSLMNKFFPDAYSSMSLRYYNSSNSAKNRMQVRASLGSMFFNDSVDASLVFGVNKYMESTVLKDRGTRLNLTHQTYDNDFYSLRPYTEVWFPASKDQGYLALIGVTNKFTHNMETETANWEFALTHDAYGALGSKPQNLEITNDGKVIRKANNIPGFADKKYSLTASDTYQAEQTSPTLNHELGLSVAMEPTALEQFTFLIHGSVSQRLAPKIEWNSAQKAVTRPTSMLGLPKYVVEPTYTAGAEINYGWSDDVTFALEGSFSDKKDNKTPYNVLGSLTVSLF